ncbi:hypothetical protein OUZ56_003591 [Daphnia magna]|uniref:Uncharacterized protein n=1 Tax=Daphnia magna TaxID=35525 RepID=A0ABR0A969_9CRUS|nr:hypothetical protein OUZ56_003591 [Daphnia magna]
MKGCVNLFLPLNDRWKANESKNLTGDYNIIVFVDEIHIQQSLPGSSTTSEVNFLLPVHISVVTDGVCVEHPDYHARDRSSIPDEV